MLPRVQGPAGGTRVSSACSSGAPPGEFEAPRGGQESGSSAPPADEPSVAVLRGRAAGAAAQVSVSDLGLVFLKTTI